MSDKELEALKQKKLRELQKRMASQEQKKEQIDNHKILETIFQERAWEVFNTARAQFPGEMVKVEQLLVNLTQAGEIRKMDGEQLYALLRKIGLPVRLNTTISYLSHGKTESLSEKIKEKTKQR
jgi:DNA-binding TFAR19-related protein (PDSD5 family)